MTLTISQGNMKLGNIPNLSLPPGKTCRWGALCFRKCYAMKSYRQYPNVRKAWDGNLALWNRNPMQFWNQLSTWIHNHEPKYFRIHVGGDLPDALYSRYLYALAEFYPTTHFLLYTKRMAFLPPRPPPKNLHVFVSRWPGDKVDGRRVKRFAQAWMYDPQNLDTRIPVDGHVCPGSCTKCKFCFHAKPGDNVVFHVH